MTAVVLDSYVPGEREDTAEFRDQAAQLKTRLVDAGVKYCVATWADTHGRAKAKITPIERFDRMISGRGPLYGVHAIDGMGNYGPVDPDQAVLPDLSSVQICPWDHTYAWFAGDIHWKAGESYALCSRSALKRQIARARELGLVFMVGIEPEFYVYRKAEDGTILPFSAIDVGPTWAYDVHVATKSGPFLHRVADTLRELEWEVDAFVQEGGHSQYEFDYGFADALTTGDRWIFLKEVLRHIAEDLGAFVSFMAKPFDDSFRSGLHFNMSLVDAESGENVMRTTTDARGYGISDIAYKFIGGLLAHAKAITAITCPTVNSYRGLIGNIGLAGLTADMSWAPVAITYGPNNRSAMLRLPDGRSCVENRATDASCNIYMGLAMSLAAGLDGIERELDPGKPCTVNLYQLQDDEREALGIERLPEDLLQALYAFDADPISERALGTELKQAFIKLKRAEWAQAHQHVSEWDRQRYLEFF